MTKIGEIHLRGDSGRDTLLGNQPQQCHCQPRSSARPPQHLPVGFWLLWCQWWTSCIETQNASPIEIVTTWLQSHSLRK